MSVELVIFDNDGTLSDSEAMNNRAVSELLIDLGFPRYTLDYCLQNLIGKNMPDIVRMVEDQEGAPLPPDTIDRFVQMIQSRTDLYLTPVDGAVDSVLELGKSYQTCVASNGERDNVCAALKAISLYDFFTDARIFTANQVARGKPEPDLFLYAANQSGISPDKAIVVEDTPWGVRAAVAAGMRVIGITAVSHNPLATAQLLRHTGAEQVCERWDQVVDYIKSSCG